MKSYKELSHDELLELQGALNKEYADAKSKGLSLNMARGKPSPEQLGFSMGIMDVLNSSSELLPVHNLSTAFRHVRRMSGKYSVPAFLSHGLDLHL